MEVQVEYDYTAEERDELTLKQGDIVTNVSQFEEGWYIGTFNGREGVFPDNFVRIIKPAPAPGSQPQESHKTQVPLGVSSPLPMSTSISNKASDYVKVAYRYNPEQSDELQLEVKDFIRVLSRDLPEDGWWRGVNLRTNKTGVFPDNFVRTADANDLDFKRALADYKSKMGSSTQRTQNSGSFSARTVQNDTTISPTGSKRYDSSAGKNDLRKRCDLSDGSPGDNDRLASKRLQNRMAANTNSTSMPRTDGRTAVKSETSRSGRTESTAQKTNGATFSLNRKSSISKPEYETTSTKASANKYRCSSLTRLDPSRPAEGTPRNMGDLQGLVQEQQDRLAAFSEQLENFTHTIDSMRREQREHAEDVAGQLSELNKKLAAVKNTQVNDRAGVAKSLKLITDHLRSLTEELDEVKKLQSNDAVELNRIRKVVLDMDSRTMLSGAGMNGAGEEYNGQFPDLTDIINGHNSSDPYPVLRSHVSSKPPTVLSFSSNGRPSYGNNVLIKCMCGHMCVCVYAIGRPFSFSHSPERVDANSAR
ncbi:SH3 domain-containing kinase-binding protein 1 [Echinococcus granulosus]|uniref:Cbl interacting protein of 85 kDa n=1 Tax=Echinococcus granulosus TaxID=6210 RepID=A0A068WFF2_ECHGR|nr:SH3 domain-containing kinase-binding protein 1 [Echinococcus granulosus]CDS18491.1 Cbl interacting protein of 85 kDa [Echinococcus granulosus]